MHAWIARRLGSSARSSVSRTVQRASSGASTLKSGSKSTLLINKSGLVGPKFPRSVEFGIRPFATWTDSKETIPELTDHFSELSTTKLLAQLKSRFLDFQPLNSTDNKVLKLYSDTLTARAEKGDSDAHLTILLAAIKDKNDDSAISDAVSWLEEASADGKNLEAMYYYALYLSTGDFAEMAEHYLGEIPVASYYIDVDNLDRFLGADQGVSPDGDASGTQFDFKAWLRAERQKRLAEQTSLPGTPSSSSPAEKVSCSTKRERNFEKSILLLEQCAASGHERAAVTLYLLTKDTPGSSKYTSEQIIQMFKKMKSGMGLLRAAEVTADGSLYEAAAATRYPPAMYQLAQIYHDSESEAHYLRFLELMHEAALLGNRDAQYMAAKIEEAKGKESAAFQWLSKAVSLPNPSQYACFDMGVVYHDATLGQTKDLQLAAKYWKLGGILGHPDCLVNLASMYYNGHGVEKSFEKSFYLNQNASVLGSSVANENLAEMYQLGTGVPQSNEMAEYYRKLAQGQDNSAEALLNMIESNVAADKAAAAKEPSDAEK